MSDDRFLPVKQMVTYRQASLLGPDRPAFSNLPPAQHYMSRLVRSRSLDLKGAAKTTTIEYSARAIALASEFQFKLHIPSLAGPPPDEPPAW